MYAWEAAIDKMVSTRWKSDRVGLAPLRMSANCDRSSTRTAFGALMERSRMSAFFNVLHLIISGTPVMWLTWYEGLTFDN